jgi:hypothetical protein
MKKAGWSVVVLAAVVMGLWGGNGTRVRAAERLPEVVEAAQKYGVDCDVLLKKAMSDERALRIYFRVGMVTDAAATDMYCGDLVKVLRAWGDARAAKFVAEEPAELREMLLGFVSYEVGGDRAAGAEWKAFEKEMPTVAKMVREGRGKGK